MINVHKFIICLSACQKLPTALILTLLGFMSANDLTAQDYRFSLGYSLKQYNLDITHNAAYSGNFGFTQKGFLDIEMERYFWHRFYLSIHGDFLLHNHGSVFLDGPVNFNHATFGTNLGIQWSRVSIYTGFHAGGVWNMLFKGNRIPDETTVWIRPNRTGSSFSIGYTVGAKYYLFKYLRLDAGFRFSSLFNNSFIPSDTDGEFPHASEIEIKPSSFTLGLSISIPLRNRKTSTGSRSSRNISRTPILSTGSLNFSSPLLGTAVITSPYGNRWTRPHQGIDLDANRGDDILAAADGVVIEARNARGYGRMVLIRHGSEYTTMYAHLNRLRVREGQRVKQGQVIGTAGDSGVATGVHLHFEIRRNGIPIDPSMYIRFQD